MFTIIYVCVPCYYNAVGGQKRVSDTPELLLIAVSGINVAVGNQTQLLKKST